ncbi:hypothetical protein AAE478_005687 [Parahypoxylon ruwenzoriense]
MFEYRIRTGPSGRQCFVRSHSFSHHHDDPHHRYHYRTRCFDSCAGISLEQWNILCEQNKNFVASNETLTRDNQTLKSDLEASNQENQRLHAFNQQMIDEVGELRRSRSRDSENSERFRRRVAALKTEVDNKDKEIERLEKENTTLSARVRVLTQTVSDGAQRIVELTASLSRWRKRADDFQSSLEDIKSRYEKTRRFLATRTSDLEDSNALVEEQRRVIQRLETTLPSRRRYSYA